ncbi:hypothetical protein [Rickettsia endosymbiont of Gonocerus acuteangulatus]|uniref:hypothetical protein n=1 Tax=Rickettsia endosymbiont of Gonocerus acuteangulatus TaxID=3066266 RepID=UPI003132C0D7
MFQGVLGLCAYKEFAGEVMTGHAFGFAMPKVLSGLVAGVAGAIYHHPTACYGNFCYSSNFNFTRKCIRNCKKCSIYRFRSSTFRIRNTAGIA